MDPPVCLVFVAAGQLQLTHDRLYVLRRVPVCDKHRVGGVHDDQVGDADRGHQPGVAVDEGVAGALHDGIASDHVARVVRVQDLRQARPGSDVPPARVQRHHRGVRRALHHGVVHGDGR